MEPNNNATYVKVQQEIASDTLNHMLRYEGVMSR